MKKLLFILLLTIPFFGFGQDRYNTDETYNIFPSDGSIQLCLKKDNSLVNGIVFDKYTNGQLFSEKRYLNGKKHGVEKQFHENGKLDHKINFEDGVVNGLWESWYENGEICSIMYWKYGEKVGVSKRYYKNGQLSSEINYNKGNLDGLYKEWYENGKLKFNGKYKDDSQDDYYESYYKNGQLKSKGKYINDGIYVRGKINLWESYFSNGQLESTGEYKNGQKNGVWKEFYENGELKSKGSFVGYMKEKDIVYPETIIDLMKEYGSVGYYNKKLYVGTKSGLWKYYYNNGKLSSEGNYKPISNDKDLTEYGTNSVEGIWKYYYSNGQLESEIERKVGKLISKKCWDKDGNKIDCKE